ncbi:MAG TPA: gliding motility-associated C-terminal domain-containing protein, partial [Flavobacterium sp.]|nr:gliding motility-associated C-terminal domain-containing protein [Flavobacterium sp.]
QCALNTSLSVIVYPSPTSISLKTTDVINERPDGIIEIIDVTSGLGPYNYSINNSSFTPNTIYSNLNPGNYTVTVKDSNGCEFSKVVTINSICLIPNVISPNNDSHNDTFDLSGCGVAKLQIFNRYGREVNSFTNYSDQWDGKNDNGETLPDGTYFYVAELKDGNSKSGWVFITQ